MAELVGVVASGISIATLAAQIASSIVKLKSYWNELQDAPEDIWLGTFRRARGPECASFRYTGGYA